MTWSGAFTVIEGLLTALELRDRFGDPMIGLGALPAMANVVGDDWDKVLDDAAAGKLQPKEYVSKMSELIEKFRGHMFMVAADRKLNELMVTQSPSA